MTEKKKSGGSFVLHRTHHYDMEELGPVGQKVPYLFNTALVDGSNEWVTRQEYDTNRNVLTMFTPASIDNYAPRTGGTGPTVTKNTTGLVHVYDYSAENRLETTKIKQGHSGTEISLSTITYDATRKWLPVSIKRFRVAGDTSTADNIELTEFAYGFIGGSGDDIAWVETEVEAELVAENGPAGTYLSYELFDSEGRNIYSIGPDKSITKRTFDNRSGQVLTVVRNATNDLGSPYHGLTTSGFGRTGDGGSLTTEYIRDLLGRVVERAALGW